MSLRDSPLLNISVFSEPPYRDWMGLVRSYKECMLLGPNLCGIPKPWIEWTEIIVSSRERRGSTVRNPLAYRLSLMWEGIILLQEAKFICDTLENALRQLICAHCARQSVLWHDLRKTVPEYWKAEERVLKDSGIVVAESHVIPPPLLLHFTFYQTTETIARNWKRIPGTPSDLAGFGNAFRRHKERRDVHSFTNDMKVLRAARNRIAHSRELFQRHETQNLFALAERWLTPLDLTVSARIIDYRRRRPRFLETLAFNIPIRDSAMRRTPNPAVRASR
jgi:hypothetical protein